MKVFNQMSPNLSSILTHGFPIQSSTGKWTRTCNLYNCKTCRLIHNVEYIVLDNQMLVPLMQNSNCHNLNSMQRFYYIEQTSATVETKNRTASYVSKKIPYSFELYIRNWSALQSIWSQSWKRFQVLHFSTFKPSPFYIPQTCFNEKQTW